MNRQARINRQKEKDDEKHRSHNDYCGAEHFVPGRPGNFFHFPAHVQIELSAFLVRRCSEVFPVPADAPPGKLASLARVLLLERTFNAPVVR